jgi:hypothetical protein
MQARVLRAWLSRSPLCLPAGVLAGLMLCTGCEVLSNDVDESVARTTSALTTTLLSASFDADPGGFAYADNVFRGATQAAYASGTWAATGGQSGGAIRVALGGVDNNTISGMSGGWSRAFTTAEPLRVSLALHVNVTQTAEYESDETSQALVAMTASCAASRRPTWSRRSPATATAALCARPGGGRRSSTWGCWPPATIR